MIDTTNQKSQYQSHSLRSEIKSLSLSLKNETELVKSQLRSQQNIFYTTFIMVSQKSLKLILKQTIFVKI